MARLYSNPNAFRRTLRTHIHRRLPPGLITAGEVAAAEAEREHRKLVEEDASRLQKKRVLKVAKATALILASKDKRRRPRGVSKELFREVRALKLTRTKRIRRTRAPKK